MNNKKLQVWFPFFFAISMVIGMFLGYKLRDKMPWSSNILRVSSPGEIQEVIDLVKNRYVDPVNADSLGELAIDEVLSALDPHSVYIPARNLREVNEDLQGRFEGIGVEFNIYDDTVHIITVLRGGPSDKAGLLPGDRIVKVEDKTVAGNGITSDGIRSLLRGPRGSQVGVTIYRNNQPEKFTITRGFIPLFALDAAYMVDGETGYIRLNKFSETAYEEFMEALEGLQKKGMKNLIFDLRENGGGILTEAVEMADEFLDGDKLIVYTEGKHNPKKEYKCRRRGLFEQGKLVLLVNEGSASASEVLAGALQDWDRATIIGRRSFGKGLVQEQYSLGDGAALRLTVARYYTPLGRSIQKPYDKGILDYNEEILERYHRGEMFNQDSTKPSNGKAYTTKNGKKVYEGGGITPDIFVGFDTTVVDTLVTEMYQKNTMGRFVYRYYVKNKEEFSRYKEPAEFEKGFTITNDIFSQFRNYAAADTIDISTLPAKDRDFVTLRLKSLFARQIWRTEGFYEVANAEDPVIKKAEEVIRKGPSL
ncbi:MAG TPA: S41 family peptidase [Chitinophagaceae bacterium]|nr:S41 family peptidase [Chitinophagaceae bacterium]